MSDALQTLEIVEIPIDPIARPNHPLILADGKFMSTLSAAEKEGAGLAIIKDAVGAQAAASLQGRVTKAEKMLNEQRLDLIRPFQTLIDNINAAAKEPKARLIRLKEALSKAQTTFTIEQARIAREAQEAQARKIRELEEKLAREKKEAEEKAQALADQVRRENEEKARVLEAARVAGLPIVEEEDWGDVVPAPVESPQKSETEKAIDAIRHAPAPIIAKASGVRERVELYPHLVDIDKVPECFITKSFKLAAVQSVYCRGWRDGDKIPEVAGIRFEVQRSHQSTGKAGF